MLSFIAQQGGEKAEVIFQNICINGAFANVSQALFVSVLKDLQRHSLIKQDSSNVIVLDKSGEKLVNNYDFYSAFTSSDDYAAVYNTHTIGYIAPIALTNNEPIPIISTGLDVIIFPWMGSCIVGTMALMLNYLGLKATAESLFVTVPNITTLEVNATISKILNSKQEDLIFNAETLAIQVENKILEKHDKYFSEKILCQNYASRYLDVQGVYDAYCRMSLK